MDAVVYAVRCDCGHVARGSSELVVDEALTHAATAHDVALDPDVVWAMAVPTRTLERHGPDAER